MQQVADAASADRELRDAIRRHLRARIRDGLLAEVDFGPAPPAPIAELLRVETNRRSGCSV